MQTARPGRGLEDSPEDVRKVSEAAVDAKLLKLQEIKLKKGEWIVKYSNCLQG